MQECLYPESVFRGCVDVDDFFACLQRYLRNVNGDRERVLPAEIADNRLLRPALFDQCGVLAFAYRKVDPVFQTTLFRATIPKNERSQSEGYELTFGIMN